MFVITSLPTPAERATHEFTFTISDKYCLCETDDGQKKLTPIGSFMGGIHLQIHNNIDAWRNTEFILMGGCMYDCWIKFPIGTFEKILENVYGFKRREGFLLTSLPTRTGDKDRVITYTFSDKYCLCEEGDGDKKLTPIGSFMGLKARIDKTGFRHTEIITMPVSTSILDISFPIGTFDRITDYIYGNKRG